MAFQGNLTRSSFEDALTPQVLMVTRIIQSALANGVLILMALVVYLYNQNFGSPSKSTDDETMIVLTIVHIALFAGAASVSSILRGRLFSPGALGEISSSEQTKELAAKCVLQQRTAIIASLAPLEGAGFFGLAVCVIGAMNGALQATPYYWFNLVSAVALLVFGVVTFPTKENLTEWFDRAILQA
jgi:hypothetical protein